MLRAVRRAAFLLAFLIACSGGDDPAPAPTSSGAPLTLEVSPDAAPWQDLPDRTAVADERYPWDNFMTKDTLNSEYEFRVRPPAPGLMAQWEQFQQDPIGGILNKGKVDFWIIAQLYRNGTVSRDKKDEVVAQLRARLAELPPDDAYKANLVVGLIHLGFDDVALDEIVKYKDEPWFAENWDANFYSGTLLFRNRQYDDAVPFLERALELHPDPWGRLWLRTALTQVPDSEARRDELFRFGDHVGGGEPQDLPFTDVADPMGIRRWHLAGAVSWIDVDNDHFLDLVANGVFAHPELYRFTPGTGYVLTDDPVLADVQNTPPGNVAADFDNDGFTDLYMTQAAWFSAGPNRVFQNDGGTGFVDRTRTSGDAPLIEQNSCGAAALDFDRDGLVDLAVTGTQGATLRLLRNKGDFVFEDVSEQAGILPLVAVTVGLAVGDFDGNGYPDVFVNSFSDPNPANWQRPENLAGAMSFPNQLYLNKGDGTFEEIADSAGVAWGTPAGFAAWSFDYDLDGDLDILATSFVNPQDQVIKGFQEKLPHGGEYMPTALYRNEGDGRRFTNVAAEAGFLPASYMGAQFVDFELDGDLDVVLGPGSHPLPYMQPLFFYRNDGGGSFTNIANLDDPTIFGKFHGTAFADYDRDGDPDLFVNNGGVMLNDRWRDLFLENTTANAGWVHLKLVGTDSNRSAIGARVEVDAGGRTLVQEVAAGQGFSSTNSPFLIFGLGPERATGEVRIRWPSGAKQTLPALASGQAIVVTEGSDELVRVY